jgi:Flp pilus assembly protein TadG
MTRQNTPKHNRKVGTAKQRGTATLEFALVGVLLFTICFGAVEGGYYFYCKNMMEGAAREGCRAGIVAGATTTTMNSTIEYQLQIAGLVPSGTTVTSSGNTYLIGNYTVEYFDNNTSTPTTNPGNIVTGDNLIVQITATWGTIGSGFRPMQLIGSNKTVLASCMMRVEG